MPSHGFVHTNSAVWGVPAQLTAQRVTTWLRPHESIQNLRHRDVPTSYHNCSPGLHCCDMCCTYRSVRSYTLVVNCSASATSLKLTIVAFGQLQFFVQPYLRVVSRIRLMPSAGRQDQSPNPRRSQCDLVCCQCCLVCCRCGLLCCSFLEPNPLVQSNALTAVPHLIVANHGCSAGHPRVRVCSNR